MGDVRKASSDAIALHLHALEMRDAEASLFSIAGVAFRVRDTVCPAPTAWPSREFDPRPLLFHFGTLQTISTATEPEISACPGLGPIKAKNLHNFLHTVISPE
uniref:DisA/LigA helix-hairpin-helix motif domain-containing protein n=1 Tax=Caenorhabditis japonica TaxID=281687 RepID=A0A8R1IHB8_CAEJA